MPDDDDGKDVEDDLARLPRRPSPAPSTRTDARAAPREVTSVTRPLFTADESAEDSVIAGGAAISADDSAEDEDDTDLFDAVATVAEVQALPAIDAATRVSAVRQPLVADRNDVSDDAAAIADLGVDDSEEDDDDEPVGERTMVSIVVPEHLQASATGYDHARPDVTDERSGLLDADAAFVDPSDLPDAFVPRSTEVVRTGSRPIEAGAALPGWMLALMVFGAVVVVVVLVVAVVFASR